MKYVQCCVWSNVCCLPQGPLSAPTQMPTAAAVAAAAATAKIQAMDALATNAIGLVQGLSSSPGSVSQLPPVGVVGAVPPVGTVGGLSTTLPAVTPPVGVIGATASVPPVGVVTSLPNLAVGGPGVGAAALPPPTVITSLPLPGGAGLAGPGPSPGPGLLGAAPGIPVVPGVAAVAGVPGTPVVAGAPPAEERRPTHQEELAKKLMEDNEPQTLQQQETMSIKGQSARHLVMQKLMRKSEVRRKDSFLLLLRGFMPHEFRGCDRT